MKLGMAVIGLVVRAWLSLWVTDTGLLVFSADTGVLQTRDCRYLVGVTVVKKLAPLSQRCTLISRGSAPLQ